MKLWFLIELAFIMLVVVLVAEDIASPAILALGWASALYRAFRWRERYMVTQIRYTIDGVIKRDVQ